jgi:energy-coupling factor transport system ATP-binding protein
LGPNGSGKTTLIRILAGLKQPTSGRYLLDGEEIRAGSEGRSLWPRVAALFEEPDPQFLTDHVEAEVAFGLESLRLPAAEVRERTARALERLGIARLAARAPQSLSAGEKARVLLAAARAGRPGCLLLDQSLAHLDPGSRRALEEDLAREALETSRAVVRTHQEADPPFSGEALHVIESGSLRSLSQLTPRGVLESTLVPFPLALRVSALLASMGRWPGPLAASVEQVERALGASRSSAKLDPSVPRREGRSTLTLAMNGVSWRPAGGREDVLRGVDLEIGAGEIVAVIGRSGTGKSTLLQLAAGLRTPSSGVVHRESHRVPRVRPVAFALEYPERQLFGRTVLEDVAALLWVEGIPAEERERSARRAMAEVGLDPDRFASRFPLSLSEGEKRRAALAGVLVEPPRLLILDEPTAGLDPEGRRALARVVRELKRRERTVLLASHDLAFVSSVADRAVLLGGGGGEPGFALAQGTPGELWEGERALERAGMPVPDFVLLARALREAGLLGAGPIRDEESLLDVLARGAAAADRLA